MYLQYRCALSVASCLRHVEVPQLRVDRGIEVNLWKQPDVFFLPECNQWLFSVSVFGGHASRLSFHLSSRRIM